MGENLVSGVFGRHKKHVPSEIKNNYVTSFVAQLVLLLENANVQSSMACCGNLQTLAQILWAPSSTSSETVFIELKGAKKVRTVTALLQHCYSTVTVLLQHCYSTVTALLKHSYSTVTALLQYWYSSVNVGS